MIRFLIFFSVAWFTLSILPHWLLAIPLAVGINKVAFG